MVLTIYSKKSGYTLIELSIVLVIIGILIAAIVASFEIKKRADGKAIITEMAVYRSALNAFVDKYGYRPGDMPNADRYFTANDFASTNGDGDSRWDTITERNVIWSQFYQSGFIEQKATYATVVARDAANSIPGVNRPTSKVSGAGWTFLDSVTVDTQQFISVLHIGGPTANNEALPQALISVDNHRYVDSKIDVPDTPKSGFYFVAETVCMVFSGGVFLDDYINTDTQKCTGNFSEITNVVTFTP